MATSGFGYPTAKAGKVDYTTNDPRKFTSQNRQIIGQQGDYLQNQNAALAAQAQGQATGTQDYLGGIEDPLAQGQGGYNAQELSQVRMTPEQQQAMVTGAGISAGTGTAASVGAAQRAANAAGGNPQALAAYRARAAQQEGSQAGDAMTQARIAASNAAAQRAENIGQTRIGQQNQALGYYGGLQAQQAGEAQQAYGREQQTYGTETGGLNQGAKTQLEASQTPTTTDKVLGGLAGAATGLLKLEEGDYMSDETTPAVVGENGPEKVVDMSAEHMQDGAIPSLANTPNTPDYLNLPQTGAGGMGTTVTNPDGSVTFTAPGAASSAKPWWSSFGSYLKKQIQDPAATPAATPAAGDPSNRPWSPVDTYSSVGKAIGQGAGLLAKGLLPQNTGSDNMAADGDIAPQLRNPKPGFGQMPQDIGPPQGANGIFTQPTRVNLHKGEAAVPLNYRAGAKVRPRFAGLPAAKGRHSYGARI